MKNARGFALGLVVGLALAISGVGFAQSTTQTTPTVEAESCCAMDACCCKSGSCSMKHDSTRMHSAGHDPKSHSEKGCCCCSDSCPTKMNKEGNK